MEGSSDGAEVYNELMIEFANPRKHCTSFSGEGVDQLITTWNFYWSTLIYPWVTMYHRIEAESLGNSHFLALTYSL